MSCDKYQDCGNGNRDLPGYCKTGCPSYSTPYPECDRLADVMEKSNALGEFIDWLGTQGISLAVPAQGNLGEEGYLRQRQGTYEQLLADYFKIDLKKVEQERRTLLASLGGKGR